MYKMWGYIHSEDKQLHMKVWFSDLDLDNAHESPFCMFVSPVYEAESQKECAKQVAMWAMPYLHLNETDSLKYIIKVQQQYGE